MTEPDGLVLLHGFTGAPASWDRVVSRLPRSLPAMRPAILGHGTEAGNEPTFEAEVDRLAARIAEEFKRPILVGYSLGARLALGLTARHPRLCSGAVLIGAHPGLDDPIERETRIEADERWAQMLERDGIEAFVRRWERQPLFASQAALPRSVRTRQRTLRLAHDPRGLARSLRVLGLGAMPSFWERLGTLEVPLCAVAGELDARFRLLAERLVAGWGGSAALRVVAAAGHNPALEQPALLADIIAKI